MPAVEAQPWSANYIDGYCGIHKRNDNYELLDPNLATFTSIDRSMCSNIADNPLFDTLQDQLIGILRVLTSRRAKYMAVSSLTDDYLDTTGNFLASVRMHLCSYVFVCVLIYILCTHK